MISPVGAIVNGLEVLEEEKDADTRAFALDLIKKSAATASAKLQFCRLAFGAAGSVGASIDTGDAEAVTRGLISDDRVKLDWQAERVLMPKNHVKLILNMCLIAIAAIPRGGVITVTTGRDGAMAQVETTGTQIRIAHGVTALVEGNVEGGVARCACDPALLCLPGRPCCRPDARVDPGAQSGLDHGTRGRRDAGGARRRQRLGRV